MNGAPRKKMSWQEELAIIDRVMKQISVVTDPEELVRIYWRGIRELIQVGDFVALSRRQVEPPAYVITRSSRFTEDINPWQERHRLPKLTGGLLGEIAYANAPVLLDDLPARLRDDDPGRFYLEGYQSLIALPVYDDGEGMNITVMLAKSQEEIDRARVPMMHWQASLFGRGTNNQVLRNRLSEALANLNRELQVVGEIQRSLLPRALPTIDGVELAAHYETSARAGGDYYDFFPLANGRWGIFIADVSGHGTPAAVLMAITHAIAHAQPGTHTPPATMLGSLNAQLARTYTREGTFITAFYAVLDPAKRTLTYSRAGHNPPRLVRGAAVITLDANGALPLGIVEEQAYEESIIQLERGDRLLLYTDGITEALEPARGSATRELFGVERLDRLLLDHPEDSAAGSVDRIREAVNAFTGHTATDDQTVIAMHLK